MQETNKYETIDISTADKSSIRFLYSTIPGRLLLKLLIRKTVSKLAGFILRSPVSCFFIDGFIKRNNINMEEYRDVKYKSFDDFFIREIKYGYRPFPENDDDVIAPCDGKLSVYPITEKSVFIIKRSMYSIDDLLHDKKLADEFSDGICMIFRLTPDDYHRYIYIDDCEILHQKRIKGVLHTVQPIAYQNCNVFCHNSREYTVMQTKNFGKVIQMEVGALFVGRISNHGKSNTIKRGEEKGMFQFGGSTIILLFRKDTIITDEAIKNNTLQNKETIVKMGDNVAVKSIRNENSIF